MGVVHPHQIQNRNWLDSLLGIETGITDRMGCGHSDRNWLDSLLGIETDFTAWLTKSTLIAIDWIPY